ncbi:MAG: hypothetical protein ACKO7P_01525 [Bacteroidota bacterium]
MIARTLLLFLVASTFLLGQGGFKKGTKGNDYILVRNDGIQFSFGPTYLMPSKAISGEITDNSGARGIYEIKPKGNIGFFAEFGMAHFPKWRPFIKNRLLDYVDWGVGYRQYSGEESTTIQFKNALGEVVSTQTGNGEFRNGYLYGRISAHNLIYIGKKKIDKAKKYFIDQSLGLNFDYNLFQGDKDYKDNFSQYQKELNFQKPLMIQMHYALGIGIRLNRAWMMIPGAQVPIFGIHQWNGFNAKMNWFSSQYWPIQAQIKFIKLFERPPKCGAYGDPQDAEFDKKFRMGN